MTPEETINTIDSFMINFEDEVEAILGRMALDSKAVIQDRVQEEGKSAANVPFADYTPQYKRSKQKKGRYTGKVDLTDTGDMWRNIGLQEKGSDGNNVFAVIAGGRKETKDKLRWNERMRKGVLALTEKEEKQAAEIFEEEIGILIDKYFERTGS